MNLKEKTQKELLDLQRDLNHSIYITECYGVSDVLLLIAVEAELDERAEAEEQRLCAAEEALA